MVTLGHVQIGLDGVSLMRETLFTSMRPAERNDVVALLRKRQAGRPAYQLAEELGIAGSYLSEIFKGTKNPGRKVLKALGLTQRTVYQEVRQ